MPNEDDRINILYALSDKNGTYSKLAGTSICSLLENTAANVVIHIFHDGSIKGENRKNFEGMVKNYRQEIRFYNARELLPEIWQQAEEIFPRAVKDERYTEAALYRLLAPQLLDYEIKKLIYLDADTIINLDILELWQEQIGDGGLAAVRELSMTERYGEGFVTEDNAVQGRFVRAVDYFNSGVLLLDLERLRRMGILLLEGLKFLALHPEESKYHDQSILNYIFASNLTPLASKFNISMEWDKEYVENRTCLEPGIYHYLGFNLGLDKNDLRDVLYYKYFLKTPWCTPEFFCNFIDGFNNFFKVCYQPMAMECSVTLRMMVAALLRKRLVIAATENFMTWILPILANVSVPGDDSTAVDTGLSLPEGARLCMLGSNEHLKLELNYDVETHFYMFFVPDYQKIHTLLTSAGMREGKDYIDGSIVLVANRRVKLPVKIQSMFEKTQS